ncbi:HAD family hydrolase [Haloquadratum walsbyi]|jgi:haloacid dehalogenase superfamily, subfamily IA, variant 1 with third motif having Dx(3-4)D or Dx(3-4)E|uniref:Putative phosphatase n=1 Tax=Haloquadratum walsbyi J07HQW2 TaxID=1238425 RepID=U1MX24_9EURY|nr:HAD hydrolase-like protein [Haloquadratum walsbyi]ERG94999.1 MAG: putative phosphatase [Haloquadratum walsbyi J07HQW2]
MDYDSLSEFEAVVWDLDGTLVQLSVNWDIVAADVAEVFQTAGIDIGGIDLWEMLNLASKRGIRDDVEAVIAEHERRGARAADRLRHANDVGSVAPQEGVCSLNCEAACKIALQIQDLDSNLTAVIGRDTIEAQKPEPDPLLHTLDELSVDPDTAVFIGDSKRDETTAERAGVSFRYAETTTV